MVEEKTLPEQTVWGRRKLRFTVEEFLKLSESGVFAGHNRLELLNGEIIEVEVIGPNHFNPVTRLDRRLQRFQEECLVSQQCPLVLSDSAPFPDIALLKLPEEDYQGRLPNPTDVLLVIEVSDSTLDDDRAKKLPMYAEAGIQEYWIVNLRQNQLEVYRDPKGSDYLTRTILQPGTPAKALCLSEAIQWD